MKAVILNSGLGSRMGELTRGRHKSMLPLSDGETVFGRQLRLLREIGVREFVVTTGAFARQLAEEAARPENKDINVTFVSNPLFRETNYIYSLYLAREYLNDDILLIHGDLVFDRACAEALLADSRPSLGMVNPNKPLPAKDFKARQRDGAIVEISTGIFGSDCCAFQPFYKLERKAVSAWVHKIESFVEHGDTGVYAENALNEILPQSPLQAFDYSAYYVDEIDDARDYARVSEEIRAFDIREQGIYPEASGRKE